MWVQKSRCALYWTLQAMSEILLRSVTERHVTTSMWLVRCENLMLHSLSIIHSQLIHKLIFQLLCLLLVTTITMLCLLHTACIPFVSCLNECLLVQVGIVYQYSIVLIGLLPLPLKHGTTCTCQLHTRVSFSNPVHTCQKYFYEQEGINITLYWLKGKLRSKHSLVFSLLFPIK